VGAIGGTDNTARDLELLSDEFKFTTISTAVAVSRAAHPSSDADAMLITASLDERPQADDRALCRLDRKVDRLHQAAIQGEQASLSKAAKDMNLVEEQHWAAVRGM
jgi:hypothetical protein